MKNLDSLISLIFKLKLVFYKEILITVLKYMFDQKNLQKYCCLNFCRTHLKDWFFKKRKIKKLF